MRYTLFILFSIWVLAAVCQDKQTTDNKQIMDNSHIRFVKQYPVSRAELKKPAITRRITDLIIGAKGSVTLSKPIAIEATNPNNFVVLDQGIEGPFLVKENAGEFPRAVRKYQNANPKNLFSSLVGMCLMPDNEILFSDSRLNKIFSFISEEKEIKEFKTSQDLQQPTGIAWSNINKELWVVETSAHRISIFNEKGELKKTIGKRGNGPGEFNYPTSIWIDKSGDVYIIDAMNFRVQIFNKDGAFESMFGKEGDATGYFARPKGIATDSYGNIYVSDALFHVIQIFDRKGQYLYNFGSQGREKEQFWMPSGMFIDDNNYIYVADSYNSRIQIFQLINND
jgi:DNA-binding beta-propeller fold protein YncE